MRSTRRLASLTGLVVALVFAHSPNAAAAEGQWPAVYASPPMFYYSTDMSPIDLTIRHSLQPLPPIPLMIPRAFIVLAEKYEKRRFGQLPPAVDTSSVTVAFTFPEGKPLSVRGREVAAARGISEAEALRGLRAQSYDARLRFTPPEIPDSTWLRQPGMVKPSGLYDGLQQLSGPAGDVYFGELGVDEFARIDCYTLAQARSGYLCKAHVRLKADLSADVDFADFRFHGGRAFANERLRVFRATVCGFVVGGCGAR